MPQTKQIGDLVLAVDYVMSLQFHRTYRLAACTVFPRGDVMSLKPETPDKRITDPALLNAIDSYLSGLQSVLKGFQLAPGVNLWEVAQRILLEEIEAKALQSQTSWIEAEYGEWIKVLSRTPGWNAAGRINRAKLNILFIKKLEGEQKRHTAGALISSDDDAVFNETDRIVKQLLDSTDAPFGATPWAIVPLS